MPGDWYAPTQPIPTRPAPYGRPGLRIPDEVIDFTPELSSPGLENLKRYKWGGDFPFSGTLYNPPIVGDTKGLLGALNLGNASGGTNWPGAGADPETGIVDAQANLSALSPESVAPPPPGFSDLPYQAGVVGQPFRLREAAGAGTYADVVQRAAGVAAPAAAPAPAPAPAPAAAAQPVQNFTTVEGLSIVKPPYGVLAAIDLTRGEVKWQVPHGDTPDAVRNHPKLKGLTVAKTGQAGSVGVPVTKTARHRRRSAGDDNARSSARRHDARLRQADRRAGGRGWMPAPVSGSR